MSPSSTWTVERSSHRPPCLRLYADGKKLQVVRYTISALVRSLFPSRDTAVEVGHPGPAEVLRVADATHFDEWRLH